jgi:hypothetical protein
MAAGRLTRPRRNVSDGHCRLWRIRHATQRSTLRAYAPLWLRRKTPSIIGLADAAGWFIAARTTMIDGAPH